MIEPKDLRIGNYLSNPDSVYSKITSIDCEWGDKSGWLCFIDDDGERNSCPLINCSPIPLTEDLLAKCGFRSKYKSCNTDWNIGSFTINQKSNEDDDGNTIPQEQVFYFDYTYEIKYLHQLQNLCYCLTGTELEVKL